MPTPSWITTTAEWFRGRPMEAAAKTKPPDESGRVAELPSVSFSDWDNLAKVKVALSALEGGDFGQAADLVDAMMRDDRISGVMDARLDALQSLELDFEPPAGEEENDRAGELAEQVERNWTRMFPESAVRDLRFWGLWLGCGFAQTPWELGERWTPKLEVWHPRNLRWDELNGALTVTARQGQVQVVGGDGRWVVYTPFGARRGWMRGLVRSLAVPWLIRQWALRDWSGHSEAHGSPAKKAKVPPGADQETKKKFLREVAGLAKRTAVLLEQGSKVQGAEIPGYDVELLEATADGHLVFKELLDAMNASIAVRVKGSNLTSEVKGGSFAATAVHGGGRRQAPVRRPDDLDVPPRPRPRALGGVQLRRPRARAVAELEHRAAG